MGNGFEGCYFMCLSALPTCMCILWVAIMSEEGMGSLELNLSHHAGAGN